jgi:pterin-4a-carbinolamine dehydratase
MAETTKLGSTTPSEIDTARHLTTRLKAERIQGAAEPDRVRDRLKAERIQGLLAELPCWRVADDGSALERTHVFPTLRAVAAYVALVLEVGEADDYVPEIDLRHLEVTLRVATATTPGLRELDFDVARRFAL